MTTVLFQPHSDDAVLFATGLCLMHKPLVITVLRSVKQDKQGVTQAEREAEDEAAFSLLGIPAFEQWPEPDSNPDWSAIRAMMVELHDRQTPELVIAPLPEENGHEQHNLIGELAIELFENVVLYATYSNGRSRTQTDFEVVFEPNWIALKHQALACYASQHRLWSTSHHFMAPLNEWML